MSTAPWWTRISAEEISQLRTRLVRDLIDSFAFELADEREDIVQYALLTLIRNKERVLPDDDGLFRYARRVLRNAAFDRVKSAAHRLSMSEDVDHSEPLSTDLAPPAMVDHQKKIQKIRRIFYELDHLDRLVLWSHVVDGHSISSIADQLGLNWHQVARMIEKVLDHFRQHLSK